MRFYTTETLSPNIGLTREGFLIAQDVPIARTGVQVYGPGEVPVDPGPDGRIEIERPPEQVFRPETIASFEGKPVTLDHPSSDVTADNWRELACGHVQNVRRGTGTLDDLMLADVIATCPNAIKAVLSGQLRQVSAGYDADYESIAPGRGRQTNIVGNHVAFVQEARCGPRCSIGDHACDRVRRGTYDAARDLVLEEGLALTVRPDKQPQDAVAYLLRSPNPPTRCGLCRHFGAPDACELVTGLIDPAGWCRLYEPPATRTTPATRAVPRAVRDAIKRRKLHVHLHL